MNRAHGSEVGAVLAVLMELVTLSDIFHVQRMQYLLHGPRGSDEDRTGLGGFMDMLVSPRTAVSKRHAVLGWLVACASSERLPGIPPGAS